MRPTTVLRVVLVILILMAGSPAGMMADAVAGGGASGETGFRVVDEEVSGPTVGGPEGQEGESPAAVAVAAEDEAGGEFTNMPFDTHFQDYFDVEGLSRDLQDLAALYPDITSLHDIAAWTERGATWDGRPIWAMKISDEPGFDDPDEADILIVGNHHAQEWMSFEVPMYLIHYLLENYGREPIDNDGDGLRDEDMLDTRDNDGDGLVDEDWSEAQVTWLVNNREFWIVPQLNPDGTAYDQSLSEPGGSGGSWRKNTRDNNRNGRFDDIFDGVDLNRNYPYHWDKPLDQEGRTVDSDVPTSDVYRGPPDDHDDDGDSRLPEGWRELPDLKRQDLVDNGIDEDPWDGIDNDRDGFVDEDKDGGFSEPETQAMEALMRRLDSDGDPHNLRSNVPVAISYHSYSALIMWPWGYTYAEAAHGPLMGYMAEEMAAFNGYDPMPTSELYLASGDWSDWLYGAHGVMAYTIEVNRGDEGGFKPAPPYILNTSRQNLGCNLYLAENADIAEYAKFMGMDSLDLDLPFINHTMGEASVSDLDPYPVTARVTNPQMVVEGSVTLHYSSDGGLSYRAVPMKDQGDGVYTGEIPPQPDQTDVRYYFTGDFGWNDGEMERTILLSAPFYAPGDYYSYSVDAMLGISGGDLAAIALGLFFFFGVTWGGFMRAIQMALTADRRKLNV